MNGHYVVTDWRQPMKRIAAERLDVTIILIIATIWALSVLHIVFSLPDELWPTELQGINGKKHKASAPL